MSKFLSCKFNIVRTLIAASPWSGYQTTLSWEKGCARPESNSRAENIKILCAGGD